MYECIKGSADTCRRGRNLTTLKMKLNAGTAIFLFFALFAAISARSLTEVESDGDFAAEESRYGLVGHPGHLEGYRKESGKEHHDDHHASHGKKGDSGFKNHHHFAKGKTSHSNFKEEEGHQSEKGGHKKQYHDQDGRHHHGYYVEKDEKGRGYQQKGGYKKGHSTKGIHEVHKLNEYKKNKEFFDEDYQEDKYEKHGGYQRQHGSQGGGNYKLGHSNRAYEVEGFGRYGHLGDVLHYLGQVGKTNREGNNEYYKHGEKSGKTRHLGEHIIFGHEFGKF